MKDGISTTIFHLLQKMMRKVIYMKKEYGEIISKHNGDWGMISQINYLSEDFIREFQDKVVWDYVCYKQKLSEDFIREFQNKVNWHWISIHQTLSEDFINEFKDRFIIE